MTAATPPEPWFLTAIDRGLQRLLALSLDRTPSGEHLASGITTSAWADAIWPGSSWERPRDEIRIAEGFRRLSRVCRSWPAPAELMDHIPKLTHTGPAVGHDRGTAAGRERGMRSVAEVLANTGVGDET